FLCILLDGLAEAKIRAPGTRPPYRQLGFPAGPEGCDVEFVHRLTMGLLYDILHFTFVGGGAF
ncbi:MAG: hypothetical protein NG740_07460, partial [Omnitrophica bacterium]|nr:hypothetical protein [Candidatus Omnitrophota bacterium]